MNRRWFRPKTPYIPEPEAPPPPPATPTLADPSVAPGGAAAVASGVSPSSLITTGAGGLTTRARTRRPSLIGS